MLKAIGAALVLAACTGIGFRIAREYRERPKQIRSLIHAVRLLQAEVEYTVTPLPQALRRVATRAQRPVDKLFAESATVLQDNEVSVDVAFAAGIEACRQTTALRRQDFDVIEEFGKTLGSSDRVHQSQHFEVALTHLTALERDAIELQRTHERLWQYIGILTGLTVVILLL